MVKYSSQTLVNYQSSSDQQTIRLSYSHPTEIFIQEYKSELQKIKMSVIDLEPVFSNLNSEFLDLQTKITSLMKKYEDIEKQIKTEKNAHFQCNKCDMKFVTSKDLQNHKKESEACQANFKCDQCEKRFRSEDQLSVHKSMHGKFKCDKCEREFNIGGILEKHMTAVHGSIKLFCHYYNNEKDCPFDTQCLFAHEHSGDCRFGNECERLLCMYQHEQHFQDEDEDEDENEEGDEGDEGDESDGADDDELEEHEYLRTVKIMDLEPSLKKVEEAMNKVNNLMKMQASRLKCDQCDFEAKNNNGLTMHQKAKHTDKSK